MAHHFVAQEPLDLVDAHELAGLRDDVLYLGVGLGVLEGLTQLDEHGQLLERLVVLAQVGGEGGERLLVDEDVVEALVGGCGDRRHGRRGRLVLGACGGFEWEWAAGASGGFVVWLLVEVDLVAALANGAELSLFSGRKT